MEIRDKEIINEKVELPKPIFLPKLPKKVTVKDVLSNIRNHKTQLEKSTSKKTGHQSYDDYLEKIIILNKKSKNRTSQLYQGRLKTGQTDIQPSSERSKIEHRKFLSLKKLDFTPEKPERKLNKPKAYNPKSHLIDQLEELIEEKGKNKKQIKKLYHYLQDNRFFRKIDGHLAKCLLRINKIVKIVAGQYIYRQGEKKQSFYIILDGTVSLVNLQLNFKKLCFKGETLNEECLFRKNTKTKENAKVTTTAYFLEFRKKDFNGLGDEVKKYGFQKMYKEMEEMLLNNFNLKKTLRNDVKHQIIK